jgi:hypothetical protein
MRPAPRHALALLAAGLTVLLGWPGVAGAEPLADDGNAEWRVEQPLPAPGYEGPRVGLGRIGDMAFYEPNRGALITAGNGGTIKAGVWFYNGAEWREISTQCGASDGRIVWAGPNEFWTISNGRPGQAPENGEAPPLEDNTICHFAPGAGGTLEIVASYASLAFESSSYQAMDAAACISPTDCWFAGGYLPPPQVGAFQLHWNGRTMTAEPYLPEGHAVRSLRQFEARLFQSVQLLPTDRVLKTVIPPPALRIINPEGTSPVVENVEEPEEQELLYGPGEFSSYLEALDLSADESALWAAAGPSALSPPRSETGVTILRYSKVHYERGSEEGIEEPTATWSQVLGPKTSPSGYQRFSINAENPFGELERVGDVLRSIGAEPGTASAWVAVAPKLGLSEEEQAIVARVSADGAISDELTLPEAIERPGERYGPLGAVETLVCPGVHDCWLTTVRGWLMHLAPAGERQLPPDGDPAFELSAPIETRPLDEGVPQVAANEGFVAEEAGPTRIPPPAVENTEPPQKFAEVDLPLLSRIRSRLVKGTTLELSFHLAVKARVRLLAKRRGRVVASTSMRTLQKGNQRLLLRLNAHQWPTKLDLQTHALGPLPKASTRESSVDAVSTSIRFPETGSLIGTGLLP